MNKLGFGFLRLPLKDAGDPKSVDVEAVKGLVDLFLEQGGTYFDTAYTYNGGMSEAALREALVKRYPRESFQIADKMPSWQLKDSSENRARFEEQLERCGVEYFDNYLIHWLNKRNYEICKKVESFEFLQQMKSAGRIRHIGFSYHDKADLLEQILKEQPCVEYVQLQLNYLDWESPAIEARRCCEICEKYHKPVIVMEPIKGGTLAQLPPEAEALFRAYAPNRSPASWAIRFAASQKQVQIVLSGMNSPEQIRDNWNCTEPLNEEELALVRRVSEVIRSQVAIPCTGCRYCEKNCPRRICIPRYFALFNEAKRAASNDAWKMASLYKELAEQNAPASACVKCRQCERNCPQQIKITDWLKEIAGVFEA